LRLGVFVSEDLSINFNNTTANFLYVTNKILDIHQLKVSSNSRPIFDDADITFELSHQPFPESSKSARLPNPALTKIVAID